MLVINEEDNTILITKHSKFSIFLNILNIV